MSVNYLQINFTAPNTSQTLDFTNINIRFSQAQLALYGSLNGGIVEIYDVIEDITTGVSYEIPWVISWVDQTTFATITAPVAGLSLGGLSQTNKIKFKLAGGTAPDIKLFIKGVVGINQNIVYNAV